jgi:hypothetical protein
MAEPSAASRSSIHFLRALREPSNYCGRGLTSRFARLRVRANFLKLFKLIWAVQSLRKKYSPFVVGQIISTSSPRPASHEGRFAIVTDVGCGMRWTLWRRKTGAA